MTICKACKIQSEKLDLWGYCPVCRKELIEEGSNYNKKAMEELPESYTTIEDKKKICKVIRRRKQ